MFRGTKPLVCASIFWMLEFGGVQFQNEASLKKGDSRHAAGLHVLQKMGWPKEGGSPGIDPEHWEHTVTNLFGELWARPGLSLRDRELVTMAVLIAAGAEGVVPHFRYACHLGFTERNIREIILQAMYYSGWSRGGLALRRFLKVKNEPGSPWRKPGKSTRRNTGKRNKKQP